MAAESGPKPIRRLDESLINRIAAGEIIHRPASALKELIENSLDAKSSSIRITIKDGGMKLLQIQDNGTGIRKADLPILAERFTTSKLVKFSDLSALRTYGFRGEALASISHVAHLSVVTKTASDSCAWKACYLDGSLSPAKPGQTADPKPCAGNTGTIVTAEDLFYNTPTRFSALRNSTEEYHRVLDVVTRYAVHNPSVSFVCKKTGSPTPDISTPSSSAVKQTINMLYGPAVARDLLQVEFSSTSTPDESDNNMDIDEGNGFWKAEAHFTSANYHAKKFTFLLFINHRLVESSRIKRAIENVYSAILPKGSSPFVYLSLEIDPRSVDVNIHPTKREVHFLDEEGIIERVSGAIQQQLADQGRSRTFEYHTQTLLTGGTLEDGPSSNSKGKGKEKQSQSEAQSRDGELNENEDLPSSVAAQNRKKVYSKDKIRTSQANRTLDSFAIANPASQAKNSNTSHSKEKYRNGSQEDEAIVDLTSVSDEPNQRGRDIEESECYLTSVATLRNGVNKAKHTHLTDIIQNHIFVGIVDLRRSLSLVQHEKRLYLLNHCSLAEELFFQLGLRQFGNFHRLKLDPPPLVRRLVRLAVKTEKGSWKESGLNVNEDEIINKIVEQLTSRAEMLNEYFSLSINDKGELESLPLLLRDYTPNLDKLPLFLMRLGPQVNWTDERECFENFLHELAYFYGPGPLAGNSDVKKSTAQGEKVERWQIEHILFPAMKRYFMAPKTLLDRDIIQVASLPDLYRVFERC